MTEIFKDGITVSIDVLYLDPNNPRLTAPGFGAGGPGYSKAEALFRMKRRNIFLILC